MRDTRGPEYAQRLLDKEGAAWKRLLDVQAPYRWNLRRLHLGRTLDVGCGIGRNLASLPEGSVGVDHNRDSVRIARDRGLTALDLDEWQTSELRADHAYDSMLVAHVVEHLDLEEARALLESYLPCVRPGGRVVLICPQERGYASDATHVRFVDFVGLADLARDAGLTPERRYSFPFPRALGRWFTYNEFCLVARTNPPRP